MSNINTAYNDRVRYTLRNKNFSSLIIAEPIGWNDDEKEYSRHEQYHGIIAKFSNSLKFIESGAEFIQLVFDIYGINEEIELIRDERHPQTDIWTLTYRSYLDLSTMQRQNNQISIKANAGGLEKILKSRESEKIEIDRLTTIDGKPIPALIPIDVELEGRNIFLKSNWETKEIDGVFDVRLRESSDENPDDTTYHVNQAIPLSLINKSHEEASDVSLGSRSFEGDIFDENPVGVAGSMFFYRAVKDRILNLKLDMSFQAVATVDKAVNWSTLSLRINRYNSVNNLSESITLHSIYRDNGTANFNGQYETTFLTPVIFDWNNYSTTNIANYNHVFNLNTGDSLALELILEGDYESSSTRDCVVSVNVTNCKMFIDENSFQEKTNAKTVLAHELADRLVTIATGNSKAFYSDFLGRTDVKDINGNPMNYSVDGKASLTGFTHGFWVRGFDKLPIPSEVPYVENNFKPISTSFKEFTESMVAVWNIGIGIEKIGFGERIRLEEKSYFFNRNVTIRLPNQVKNVNRIVSVNKYYSAIDVGYELGGSYEEACGLDEYNVKSNFTTIINTKNSYSVLSKYRADSYGMEFARRKQKSLNNTEDTTYDNNVFLMDLKRGVSSLFKQRKWQDDFSQPPTGTFSPDTATNLRFSPFNCLLRHSWWFSGGFKRYAIDYVRYGSSVANSKLKTKLRTDVAYSSNPSNTPGNGNEYAEDGNIINSELQTARFFPEEIEFEHTCDFNTMQQVNGSKVILGKTIQNFYGLVEFINENGEKETGFLMNLKPNNKGAWRVLKANR